MRLNAYLKRINYPIDSKRADLKVDLATLSALHEAHLKAIPYENLDIHLGKPLSLDTRTIFNKLVYEQRGGWCYEMNSLFAFVLTKLGFKVTLLGGAVGWQERGDAANLNHLLLLVKLDQFYLVDVGFGGGFLRPLPLLEGEYKQGFMKFYLERLKPEKLKPERLKPDRQNLDKLTASQARRYLATEVWRFHNHKDGGAKDFDFSLEPRKITEFAEQCHRLQTSKQSGFVNVTVCQKFTDTGIVVLRGAVLKEISEAGTKEIILDSEKAFQEALQTHYGIRLRNSKKLWQSVWEKHQKWQDLGE